MPLSFEWDGRKAASNLKRHGVSFEVAASAFSDPLAKIFSDPEHSTVELREILIGRSGAERLILISFTEVGPDRVRLISARRATKREQRDYEENVKV